MNILVIGNGFDIAHGLPTSYQQFLRFVSEEGEMSSRLQKNGLSPMESAVAADDIKNLSSNNYWIPFLIATITGMVLIWSSDKITVLLRKRG